MAKTIWLRDETYHRLDELRGKRETFNQLINRLCHIMETLETIPGTLGPSHYLRERPKTEK